MREIFAIIAVSMTISAEACDLAEEYLSLRESWEKTSETAYLSCTASVEMTQHWYKYDQCVQNGDAINSKYGCGDLVSLEGGKYQSLSVDVAVCNPLKVGSELNEKNFEMQRKKLGIVKCKKT